MIDQKFKSFLEGNKIYFETVVALSLSFMAVYVSVQANKIAKSQTKLMQEEALPQLEIRTAQEYNPSTKIYDNNLWLFYNRGGTLTNFDVRHYSFLNITYRPDYDSIVYPIYSYFSMGGILTGEDKGLIYQIDNNHHGQKEIQLQDSLAPILGYYDINSYIKVSFTDIFDEQHVEYYQIGPGIYKISEKDWHYYEQSFKRSKVKLTFPKIKVIELLDSIKKLNEHKL